MRALEKRFRCQLLAASKLAFGICFCLSFASTSRAQAFDVKLDKSRTKIEYSVDSTLHTVQGTFKLKSGEIHFDTNSGKATGLVTVDATSGDSGNKSRDKKMHQEILESQKYPDVIFTPQEVRGTFNPKQESELDVSGLLRLHGSDHPITAKIVVQAPAGSQVLSTAHFDIPYVKWGMKDSSTFFLHASDTVEINVEAWGQISTESSTR